MPSQDYEDEQGAGSSLTRQRENSKRKHTYGTSKPSSGIRVLVENRERTRDALRTSTRIHPCNFEDTGWLDRAKPSLLPRPTADIHGRPLTGHACTA